VPAKSGASHALAAFLSIVLGSVLSDFISSYSGLMTTASESAGGTITGTTGITLSENAVGLLTIPTALSFLWGVAYHRARYQSETEASRRKNFVTDNHSPNTPKQMPTPDAQDGETSSSVNARSGYLAVENGQTAKETLSAVQRDLDDVRFVLTELHDRLVDGIESIQDTTDGADSFFWERRLLIRDLDRTVSKQQVILDQQEPKP
jgi:hypothetical protein